MADELIKNVSVHISSRSFLNITFNIFQCGNCDVENGFQFTTTEDGVYQLFYLNSGDGYLKTDSYTSKIRANSGFFIFPDVRYTFTAVGGETANLTWVTFSGFRVDHYLGRAAIWPSQPVFDDAEGAVGEKLNALYMKSHKMPNRYCKMMSLLYDIFAYLLDNNPPQKFYGYRDTANYFAIAATEYIEQNYMNPITIDEVAKKLGISRKHLCTVFHQILKITPKQFLIYYRLEKACKLLRTSSQSVQQISEAVGYTNQFYFSKEFKRVVGKKPSEYRSSSENLEFFSYYSFLATLMRQNEQNELNTPGDWKVIIKPSGKDTGRREQKNGK